MAEEIEKDKGKDIAGEENASVANEADLTGKELTGKDTSSDSQSKDVVKDLDAGAQSEDDAPEKNQAEGVNPADDATEEKQSVDVNPADDALAEAQPGDSSEIQAVDYSSFSIDDLVSTLNILVAERPVYEIRDKIEQIKTNFYKKLRAETEKVKKKFLHEGGKEEDFMHEPDPREMKVKEALNQYKSKKQKHNKLLEEEKQLNLEEKYKIIEGIKGLINKEESINKTFQEFREYQERWRSTGLVPQSKLKDLWDNYHHHVEKFYDYIKINKELRDLDLRKNMEVKMQLCEKAEALLLKDDSVSNFRILQKYHEEWREVGPVHAEIKEQLWERFKLATAKINKRHQQYYEEMKQSLKKNLEEKTKLCEEVENILEEEIANHKLWVAKSKVVIDIQKKWRTIGFAPKKFNNQVYDRFRKACDAFFDKKREFYTENKELQQNNLQLKTDLCKQAEAIKDSEDWKKTTAELIMLQKKWKEIGPVPKKLSDKVWKQFRGACDYFFDRKSEFYSTIDQKYEKNLKDKEELIGRIENYKLGEDADNNFDALKEFQRQWAEIGYVPIKQKEEINTKYRKAVDDFFDKLDIDEEKKNVLRYRNKLDNMKSIPRGRDKLNVEREKFVNKLKQLESDIALWENNIGFFAKSKNAESMIKEVSLKIEKAKGSISLLEEKIKMIDKIS